MQFQWYPGHMTKAKRQMQEDIKLIDLVIELVDARIPLSSRNPDIDELGKNKSRLILMNKSDLADEAVSREWAEFFKKKGYVDKDADRFLIRPINPYSPPYTLMLSDELLHKTVEEFEASLPVAVTIIDIPEND